MDAIIGTEDFHTAMYQANLLYGIELDEDEFEEIGLIAWEQIGNKRVQNYKYCTKVECGKNFIELPCNCDIIESVTYGFEDWNYTDNLHIDGDIDSAFTEHYIEARKGFVDPLYISGKLVNYERVGDKLYINSEYRGPINILYRGVILDDDGLPEITSKEKDAIAAYIAYTEKFKKYLQTNNQQIMQQAQFLQREWVRLCDAARVDAYLNQNAMDRILDSKSSWNRKIFRKSFKIKV